jgi:hypothetical protein
MVFECLVSKYKTSQSSITAKEITKWFDFLLTAHSDYNNISILMYYFDKGKLRPLLKDLLLKGLETYSEWVEPS